MLKAYEVSPSFQRTRPFFDRNLDGQGWSRHALQAYRPDDGSIGGAHFQWALLDASLNVAGSRPQAMLAYLGEVSAEVRAAFASGQLERRWFVAAALGPDFSVFDRHFWVSVVELGATLLNSGSPHLPAVAAIGKDPQIEADFNRIAHRRTALLQQGWQMVGWVGDAVRGGPQGIVLDEAARNAGSSLQLIDRPGSANKVPDLNVQPAVLPPRRFELLVHGDSAGHLTVHYGRQTTEIPLAQLRSLAPGSGYDYDGVHVFVDRALVTSQLAESKPFIIATWLSTVAHHVMRLLFIVAALWLVVLLVLRRRLQLSPDARLAILLIATLALSVFLPRLALLAGIDANMYPGTEPRYLAAAAFALWYSAAFAVAHGLYVLFRRDRKT
jgi:hypothetical protein